MDTKYVDYFLKGAWLSKAKSYVNDSAKRKELLAKVTEYVSKSGLSSVKETLLLMYNYVSDTACGRYVEYSTGNLIMIIAALVYLVSPMDFLPDLLPSGLIDDAAIITWAFNRAGTELARYKEWKEKRAK